MVAGEALIFINFVILCRESLPQHANCVNYLGYFFAAPYENPSIKRKKVD